MSKTYNDPAFPTHPLQSQMGQLLVSFGVTKLEIITAVVYASHGGRLDTAAAVNVAAQIIDSCEAYNKQQEPAETTNDGKLIILK